MSAYYEEFGKKQKEHRELLQQHVDKIYSVGGKLRYIKVYDEWHAIHRGVILKAPIPRNSEGYDELIEKLEQ